MIGCGCCILNRPRSVAGSGSRSEFRPTRSAKSCTHLAVKLPRIFRVLLNPSNSCTTQAPSNDPFQPAQNVCSSEPPHIEYDTSSGVDDFRSLLIGVMCVLAVATPAQQTRRRFLLAYPTLSIAARRVVPTTVSAADAHIHRPRTSLRQMLGVDEGIGQQYLVV